MSSDVLDLRLAYDDGMDPFAYDRWKTDPGDDGLTECPSCHHDVAASEPTCPHCGHSLLGGADETENLVPGGMGFQDDYSGWNDHMASTWHVAEDNGVVIEPYTDQRQDYNDYDDTGGMSRSQKVGFEQWVDDAIDQLNDLQARGVQTNGYDLNDPNLIEATPELNQIAEHLSHNGCPDPQGALRRALMQPMDQNGQRVHSGPDQDGGAPDLVQAPQGGPDTPMANGAFEGQAPTGQTLAHVRTPAGEVGYVIARWEDVWGVPHVRIQTIGAHGDHPMELREEDVEPVELPEMSPVSQIQEFVDSLAREPMDSTLASITTRIQGLSSVRESIRYHLSHSAALTGEEHAYLTDLDEGVQLALMRLHEAAVEDNAEEQAYLAGQRQYRLADEAPRSGYGDDLPALDEPGLVAGDDQLEAVHLEHPDMLVDELPSVLRTDEEAVTAAAVRHIDTFTEGLSGELRDHHRDRFVEAVHAAASGYEMPAEEPAPEPEYDLDGPLEEIFLD